MRLLASRLLCHKTPEYLGCGVVVHPVFMKPCEPQQKREVGLSQPSSWLLSPLLVALCGQEFPGIEVEGSLVGCRLVRTVGGPGGFLEGLYVHPLGTLRTQHYRLILGCQVVGTRDRIGCEDSAGAMES